MKSIEFAREVDAIQCCFIHFSEECSADLTSKASNIVKEVGFFWISIVHENDMYRVISALRSTIDFSKKFFKAFC